MKFCRVRVALYVAVVSLLFSSNALAISVTYEWVPDSVSSGFGTIVINDANISDPSNFGSPGAIVDDDSLVSLSFTFPENGLTFNLSDFNFNNVANDTAVGADGWTASGGFLTNVFQFKGISQSLKDLGVQSVRVSQGALLNGLNDLLPIRSGSLTFEQQTGQWQLVPEPSTAVLLGLGLVTLTIRRRGRS